MIERVPFKIVKPVQQVRYARLCPFCRKVRGKMRYFVSGHLSEMRSERAQAEDRAVSAKGVERAGVIEFWVTYGPIGLRAQFGGSRRETGRGQRKWRRIGDRFDPAGG
jgi:hypothetical protein